MKKVQMKKTLEKMLKGSRTFRDIKPRYISKNGNNTILYHENAVITISTVDRSFTTHIVDTRLGIVHDFDKRYMPQFQKDFQEHPQHPFWDEKMPETDGEMLDYLYEAHKYHVGRVMNIYIECEA
jgi:hypothetical protein